ncbi:MULTISPECIES: barstar family protein [Bacillus cereus group]|uniref:barstar family protein n=1 Tax=Bacillus cereus group TaxID=86661 RepID=UPI000BF96852|nr:MULTISPECIES: barstar family protein [Bacillus cereus group]MCU5489938.1 barstar family protein [Bacillus cereus]PFW00902.1 barnase inhibitor [Bacillus thuringiensis]PGR96177.1 barnase inhibitor [Bacillus thuringiensis]QWS01219.1 barstar family protein [Bacillus cereus]
MSNEHRSIMGIDVCNINSAKELHLLLKEKLEFPDFYGENWDAFWDCITGFVSPLPNKIIFNGWSKLENKLPRDTKIMKECLLDYNKEDRKDPEWKSEFLFN